ncbi:MAG: PspC domain-containing protein [Thermoprotei archaeon]|nr:MAG: PspC domain-containing protein [Thermoprotei archaeon]RLE89538.1 MAG: PspC domain-containing protein [Thermoprotei archaeon]
MGEIRRLYRSKKDRMIAGVCGGIAEYLGIDPTIVRLLWILLCLINGIGILLYILAAIIIPEEPREGVEGEQNLGQNIIYILLLLLGVILLCVGGIGLSIILTPWLFPTVLSILFSFWYKLLHVFKYLVFLLLIIIGIILIAKAYRLERKRRKEPSSE